MNLEDDHFFKEIQGFSTLISPVQHCENNYYHDYCRLYLANFVLTNQVKDLIRDKKELEEKVYQLEERHYDEGDSDVVNRGKRMRRTANQIHRFHVCNVEGCGKSYGSEGSLNQHLKIKHAELVKSEEEGEGEEENYSSVQVSKENVRGNTQKKGRKK